MFSRIEIHLRQEAWLASVGGRNETGLEVARRIASQHTVPAARERGAGGRLLALRRRGLRQHQRISSTGSTPMISRPDAMIVAVAWTRARRAAVSAASVAIRNRKRALSLPLVQRT